MPPTKHFGPSTAPAVPIDDVSISVGFRRDGVEEVHEFTARPQLTYADTVGLIREQRRGGAQVLPYMDRVIRRSLRDDDGTPASWTPEIADGGFVDPAGVRRPIVELDKVQADGSSRRRWVHLMEDDDEVTVEFEQIMELFEYLAGEAGQRPT